MKYGILLGVFGLMACQSSPGISYPSVPEQDRPFVYPSADQLDVHFLCDSIYSIPQFKSKPYVQSAAPQLLVVTDSTVTVYFSNDYTQSVAKPGNVHLPAGTYQCQ